MRWLRLRHAGASASGLTAHAFIQPASTTLRHRRDRRRLISEELLLNDFDFFEGTWDVANRRRTDYLDESSEWEEFPAVSHAARYLDSRANFASIVFPTKAYSGISLRLYDASRDEWSLYWVASNRTGSLDPPVVGRFTDGRAEFFCDDIWDGKAIRVRNTWSDISVDSCHWAQAFSVDQGHTWLVNWQMHYTRRPADQPD
jgi:hypothetical protein